MTFARRNRTRDARLRRFGAFFATLLFVAHAVPVHAYCRRSACNGAAAWVCTPATAADCGTAVRWRSPTLTIAIARPETPLQEAIAAAVTRAARRWLEAPCGDGSHPHLRIDTVVREASAPPGNDADIRVAFARTWPADRGTFASTKLHFDAHGTLAFARITFYPLVLAPYGASPLPESIALHEMGHALGLAHAQQPIAAAMDARVHDGAREVSALTADDVAGICAAYPPGD